MANVFPLPVSTEFAAVFVLSPKTEAGNEGKIENLEVIINSGVATGIITEDGLGVEVVSDTEQIVNITIQADKKIGEGVELISEDFDIAFS